MHRRLALRPKASHAHAQRLMLASLLILLWTLLHMPMLHCACSKLRVMMALVLLLLLPLLLLLVLCSTLANVLKSWIRCSCRIMSKTNILMAHDRLEHI
jgi:hypothetical protein